MPTLSGETVRFTSQITNTLNIIKKRMDRRLWAHEEDEIIGRLVAKHGTKKWPIISEQLLIEGGFERTGKQCRERWYNHLNPEISHSKWSQADEQLLFKAHRQYGNKWKNISKLFLGRTDNAIKNHFYSTLRKSLRRINKLHGEKNSTLKMRLIKPHVLSEILSDIDLTELIFTLGRDKPRKWQREREAVQANCVGFDEMITKLMRINAEYEIRKKMKNETKRIRGRRAVQESLIEDAKEEPTQFVKTMPSQSAKEQISVEKEEVNTTTIRISRRLKSRQIKRKLRRRQHKSYETKQSEAQIEQQQNSPVKDFRTRKMINYYQMHFGNTIQVSKKPIPPPLSPPKSFSSSKQTPARSNNSQVDDEARRSKNSGNKIDRIVQTTRFLKEDIELDKQLQEVQSVIEEEEVNKYHENAPVSSHNMFIDINMVSYEPRYPSPMCRKELDQLVVVGTHVKMFPTPRMNQNSNDVNRHESVQRKISEDEYIEEILEINFDADFAMKEEEDPGESDD